MCTTAYIRTCSLHKYDEYLNCVSYTVTSATICVCVCVMLCVMLCVMWGSASLLSLPPCSFTSSSSIIFRAPSLRPQTPSRTKRFAVSLSPSLFVSLRPLISLCHPHSPPSSTPTPPFTLSVSCLPFVINLLPRSIILSAPPSARSLAPQPTVIWQLYEFYTLAECNYVQLISRNGSQAPRHRSLMTFDNRRADSGKLWFV